MRGRGPRGWIHGAPRLPAPTSNAPPQELLPEGRDARSRPEGVDPRAPRLPAPTSIAPPRELLPEGRNARSPHESSPAQDAALPWELRHEGRKTQTPHRQRRRAPTPKHARPTTKNYLLLIFAINKFLY